MGIKQIVGACDWSTCPGEWAKPLPGLQGRGFGFSPPPHYHFPYIAAAPHSAPGTASERIKTTIAWSLQNLRLSPLTPLEVSLSLLSLSLCLLRLPRNGVSSPPILPLLSTDGDFVFVPATCFLMRDVCVCRFVVRRGSNGKREDCDPEDRQLDEQAGDVLKEAERPAEESEGARDPLRCWSRSHHLLQHREAVRLLQLQVGPAPSSFSRAEFRWLCARLAAVGGWSSRLPILCILIALQRASFVYLGKFQVKRLSSIGVDFIGWWIEHEIYHTSYALSLNLAMYHHLTNQ